MNSVSLYFRLSAFDESLHGGGYIDEVAIFNVALSESDIKDAMNKGLASVSAVYPGGKLATTWSHIKTQD